GYAVVPDGADAIRTHGDRSTQVARQCVGSGAKALMQVRCLTLRSNESLRRIHDRNDSAHDGNGDGAGNEHFRHRHGAVLVSNAAYVVLPAAAVAAAADAISCASDSSAVARIAEAISASMSEKP